MEPLTDDEKHVLQLLLEGRSGVEIASALVVSPDVVTGYVQSLLVKLRVHSRLEAAAFTMWPDPTPPLPPAASAALAVPFQRAEDIPRHVGEPLRPRSARHST